MLKKIFRTFVAKFLTFALVMVVAAPVVGSLANDAMTDLQNNTAVLQEQATTPLIVNFNIQKGSAQITKTFGGGIVQTVANCGANGPNYTCKVDLPADTYTITFNEVAGYKTPGLIKMDLDGTDDVIKGNYTLNSQNEDDQNNSPNNSPNSNLPFVAPTAKFNLKVNVNIPEGGAVITETFGNKEVTKLNNCAPNGQYYTCSVELLNDTYTVKFTDANGYTTPGLLKVQLNGVDDEVTGIYTKQQEEVKDYTLTVHVNIPEGGAVVTETFTNKEVSKLYNCAPNGQYYTCKVDLPDDTYTVTFTDVNGYTTPSLVKIQLDGIDDTVYGIYTQKPAEDGRVNFNVSTRDNQGNPLNEEYIRNALTTHTTPHAFSEQLANLNNYTFKFKDKTCYTTPGTVVVTNKVINSLPANVVILENGANYAVGTALKPNATYSIIGTYVKITNCGEQNDGAAFSVVKTATEQLLADGNKIVDYKITVKRNANGPTGNYSILVDDTVNDKNNRTIYGSNGGSMTVVKKANNVYSTCSNGCGDITAGPVTVNTTQPNQEVVLAYQMKSDNSGIPDNQTSTFTNTVIGKYTQDGQNKTTTDQEVVTIGENGNNDGDLFTVTKRATEQLLSDGNKRVRYEITVKRNNGASGTYYVLVDDSINDNGNRTINGSNGGTLTVVPSSNNVYSTCSNGCGDITAGPVNVKTTTAGETVTMTYDAVTKNSTVPNNQTTTFTNTAVGRYTQDGENKQTNSEVAVNVTKNVTSTPNTPYYPPAPAPAPPTPQPDRLVNNGPGQLLLLLAVSALGAYGWQTLAQRRKLARSK